MGFIVRWVFPTILPVIMNALLMVLKKLAADSDSKVDDKMLEVVKNEQGNIEALILNEARKLI